MSQVTIYLDSDSIKKLENAAELEKKSLSKWCKERLLQSISKEFPPDFFDLFGSIKDDSFERPLQISPSYDSTREAL